MHVLCYVSLYAYMCLYATHEQSLKLDRWFYGLIEKASENWTNCRTIWGRRNASSQCWSSPLRHKSTWWCFSSAVASCDFICWYVSLDVSDASCEWHSVALYQSHSWQLCCAVVSSAVQHGALMNLFSPHDQLSRIRYCDLHCREQLFLPDFSNCYPEQSSISGLRVAELELISENPTTTSRLR